MLEKIKASKKANKSNKPPESPFKKKWALIEKKQQRNKKHQATVAALYVTFQQDVLPQEKLAAESIAKQTRHLIGFIKRKSLAQWQREALMEWIEDNVDVLQSNPFYDPDLTSALLKEYQSELLSLNPKANEAVTTDDVEALRDLTDEMFEGLKTFTDEELIDFVKNPQLLQQAMKDFLEEQDFGEEEQDDDEEADDDFFNHWGDGDTGPFGGQPDNKQHQDKLKSLFNGSELAKIYKMLASKLHPDKESDPSLKAHKSELMGLLSKAKKDKDAFTLIQMFETHMPEKALEFDPNISRALVQLLDEKLAELDREYDGLKNEPGLSAAVWHKLGGKSKKATNKNIAKYLADLTDARVGHEHLINNVTTVKVLKAYLTERYDQIQADDEFDVFAMLDEMMG
jgi:hypothetical protein